MTEVRDSDALVAKAYALADWLDKSQHEKWSLGDTPVEGFSAEAVLVRKLAARIAPLTTEARPAVDVEQILWHGYNAAADAPEGSRTKILAETITKARVALATTPAGQINAGLVEALETIANGTLDAAPPYRALAATQLGQIARTALAAAKGQGEAP